MDLLKKYWKKIRKELVESVKEGLRVFLMAVVPLLIVQLESGEFMWRSLALAGAIAVLRFIDKLLHRTKIAEKGIVRF